MVLLFMMAMQARAYVFTAGKNINERLERQGGRVGACSGVSMFMLTLRDIDGDHDYLGLEGVGADGRSFVHAAEFGLNGALPKVRRVRRGVYLVYTASNPFWRNPVLFLHVDDKGVITDLETSGRRRLCRLRN